MRFEGSVPSQAFMTATEVRRALDKFNDIYAKVRYVRLKSRLLESKNPVVDTDRRVLLTRFAWVFPKA